MIHFLKMNGLGNDFVILDARDQIFTLSQEQIQKICHRRFGIGCDQLILLEEPKSDQADVFMRIYNPNGLEAGACGNAMRCVGSLLAKEFKRDTIKIETIEGILSATLLADNLITVDMGAPRLNWQQIPLNHEPKDIFALDINEGVLSTPSAVSMGNPHMVFFVQDVEGLDIETLGARLTAHPYFPEGANVEFVEVQDKTNLRMRVYERGTGVTLACGTGAAASVVAACHRNICPKNTPICVHLDGGFLDITYQESVLITGPASFVCDGNFDKRILESVQAQCPPNRAAAN